ncbi:tyrosine-protein phosphatase [Priestia flexa]|jgi:protein-tyrosine phosphatase|uniref:Tyrosine-protein phosphatase n=1 Tax=Priestia flexa TaxID=86664 RepID=A0A8I1MHQ4_9BACI|nr:tyrosine-protein phosphatase [Priestia flexa]AQX56149.1 hypothetical protein BC359_18880 [Priestia flexa]MBN8252823.1 tyrosine-protein phosphatase [Priestia flexa]MBN8435243.1 tyrosine-protein phosphatase [Priestia flexa]MCA0967839.1 tyrosine-protein phosphatase [Priestia flexa]RIV04437.1 tyrosine-protein phosphatase [Priestia flexa]
MNYNFKKLFNFRDVGGVVTENGEKLKEGVLFRSEDLSKLTKQDIETFRQLNIKAICDLRMPSEQKSKVSRVQPGPDIELLSVSIHDKSQEFTHFEFLKFLVSKSTTVDFEKIMRDMYEHMAFGCHDEMKEIICFLSDANRVPALIHCTGGKDRTGFVAAIIQLYLGVPYETVIDEYLKSNDLIAAKMKRTESFIRWMSLFRISPEQIRPVLEVRREYFEDVYQKIMKQYGDIGTYLEKGCNIPRGCLEQLNEMFLSSNEGQ